MTDANKKTISPKSEVKSADSFSSRGPRSDASRPGHAQTSGVKKEAKVSKKKKSFSTWVKEKKVRHPVYLRVAAGYSDDTQLTEEEFHQAVRKHLMNKE